MRPRGCNIQSIKNDFLAEANDQLDQVERQIVRTRPAFPT